MKTATRPVDRPKQETRCDSKWCTSTDWTYYGFYKLCPEHKPRALHLPLRGPVCVLCAEAKDDHADWCPAQRFSLCALPAINLNGGGFVK